LRRRYSKQAGLEFQPRSSTLPETISYYSRYDLIDEALQNNIDMVNLVHSDIEKALEFANKNDEHGRKSKYSSEQVLRIAISQVIEGESLRDITVRVDESTFLRTFTRIYNDKMMSFTTFCTLRNAIKPETWQAMNERLSRYAIEKKLISGDMLRVDTTAVETNIHWPTDSSLLWDTYRKCAALIRLARKMRPGIDNGRRLQDRKAKKVAQKIARKAGKKNANDKSPGSDTVKTLYSDLISMVSNILSLTAEVQNKLLDRHSKDASNQLKITALLTFVWVA